MKNTLILTLCFMVNYSLSAQEDYVVPEESIFIINLGTSITPGKISKIELLGSKEKIKLLFTMFGVHDKEFATQYNVMDKASSLNVKLLRRGGFAAKLRPIQ